MAFVRSPYRINLTCVRIFKFVCELSRSILVDTLNSTRAADGLWVLSYGRSHKWHRTNTLSSGHFIDLCLFYRNAGNIRRQSVECQLYGRYFYEWLGLLSCVEPAIASRSKTWLGGGWVRDRLPRAARLVARHSVFSRYSLVVSVKWTMVQLTVVQAPKLWQPWLPGKTTFLNVDDFKASAIRAGGRYVSLPFVCPI